MDEICQKFLTAQISYDERQMRPVVMKDSVTGKELFIFHDINDVTQRLNVRQSYISKCCSGSYANAYGFKWSFYDKEPFLDGMLLSLPFPLPLFYMSLFFSDIFSLLHVFLFIY